MVVRWVFEDVYEKGSSPYSYTLHINPNQGGTPSATKSVTTLNSGAGGDRGAIIQEGAMSAPEMTFSGVILTQAHLEKLELWYDKRILIEITDDLGRKFRGVFSKWEPTRERKASNVWYHNFTASFVVTGYRTASGNDRYGRFE
jgi:hypothetical protein